MVQVIPEKITPPAELPRVSRVRLLQTLSESMEGCNSTIVAGRAGTGKTMLATDFARRSGRRVAWYKLDAPDSELAVFLRHLCASLGRVRPGFGEKTLERVGFEVRTEDVPAAVEYLVYELLESNEPALIVIDDLHLVYDAEWMVPFFRRWLPLLPPEVHVILMGRSLPPTPLWRMRSKQTLCVLEEETLAFTLEEARSLYASYGLPGAGADAALRETRGRAATLDARARRDGLAEEKERAASTRGARQSGRLSLRLVKTPCKSMGTA
jgi:ATP/maltotriose-dependent transcriptional regulator MalT